MTLSVHKVLPDRSKIIIKRGDEVRRWAKHLGVSEEALRQAIDKVGNAAAAVRKELRVREGLPPDEY